LRGEIRLRAEREAANLFVWRGDQQFIFLLN